MLTQYLKQACVFTYTKNIYVICYVQCSSLIQHQLDQSGAGLSNLPNFQTAHIVTKFFMGNFCYFAANQQRMCTYQLFSFHDKKT